MATVGQKRKLLDTSLRVLGWILEHARQALHLCSSNSVGVIGR
ncbi:MAG: hypothetical protein ACRDJ3_07100 [Solirubrobacteraceae bacterium]